MKLLHEEGDLRYYHLCAYEYMKLLSKLVYRPGDLSPLERTDILFWKGKLGRVYPYPEF